MPCFVARNVGIDLAVGALEIGVRDEAGPAMSRAGHVDHVEVVLVDDSVEVDVDEIEPGVVPQWPSRRGLMCSLVSGS